MRNLTFFLLIIILSSCSDLSTVNDDDIMIAQTEMIGVTIDEEAFEERTTLDVTACAKMVRLDTKTTPETPAVDYLSEIRPGMDTLQFEFTSSTSNCVFEPYAVEIVSTGRSPELQMETIRIKNKKYLKVWIDFLNSNEFEDQIFKYNIYFKVREAGKDDSNIYVIDPKLQMRGC